MGPPTSQGVVQRWKDNLGNRLNDTAWPVVNVRYSGLIFMALIWGHWVVFMPVSPTRLSAPQEQKFQSPAQGPRWRPSQHLSDLLDEWPRSSSLVVSNIYMLGPRAAWTGRLGLRCNERRTIFVWASSKSLKLIFQLLSVSTGHVGITVVLPPRAPTRINKWLFIKHLRQGWPQQCCVRVVETKISHYIPFKGPHLASSHFLPPPPQGLGHNALTRQAPYSFTPRPGWSITRKALLPTDPPPHTQGWVSCFMPGAPCRSKNHRILEQTKKV